MDSEDLIDSLNMTFFQENRHMSSRITSWDQVIPDVHKIATCLGDHFVEIQGKDAPRSHQHVRAQKDKLQKEVDTLTAQKKADQRALADAQADNEKLREEVRKLTAPNGELQQGLDTTHHREERLRGSSIDSADAESCLILAGDGSRES